MADKKQTKGAAAAGNPASGKKGEESKKEEVKDALAEEDLVSHHICLEISYIMHEL